MQIPEIVMYVYENLKRKWKERQQTELTGSNITTSVAIGNDSERIIPKEMLPIAVPEPATPDIMFRNLHDTEILKELLAQNFERINKEMKEIVAKISFNERKLENIEVSIADMKTTYHVNNF